MPVREQGCIDLAMEYAGNIHIVLILNHLDQTIVPPCSQELQRLDCAITQKVPLWCDRLLYTDKDSPVFAGCC